MRHRLLTPIACVALLAACGPAPEPPAIDAAPLAPATVAPPAPVVPATPRPRSSAPLGFVIELADGQGEADIRRAADGVVREVLAIDRLFADVDPADDPQRLAQFHRLLAASPVGEGTAWDLAYQLAERGPFPGVEPDTDDTLVESNKRAAVGACLGNEGVPAPSDAGWSLKLAQMRVEQARLLAPPAGGNVFGEGVRICHPDSGWTSHVDLDLAQIDQVRSLNLLDGGSDARDPLGYAGNPGHGTATGSVLISSGGFDANGTTPPGIVVGLAPRATLVPIRALKSVIQVFDSDIARAVRHATTAQCDVVSMSLGGRAFFGLERAINDAVDRGVIVVAAAGNCVGMVVAPAAYDRSIAVAATNAADQPWNGSSRGSAVDIAAPGEDVYVARAQPGPTPATTADPGDGTSFATAAVAGAAAVWIGFHGRAAIDQARGSLTRRDLYLRLAAASARKPAGWNAGKYGAGILDLEALLRQPLGAPRTELRGPPGDDPVALLARMLDQKPDEVRAGVARLLRSPADLDAELRRYGPELLDLAARDPDAFRAAIAPRPRDALLPPEQMHAVGGRASRALSARMGATR